MPLRMLLYQGQPQSYNQEKPPIYQNYSVKQQLGVTKQGTSQCSFVTKNIELHVSETLLKIRHRAHHVYVDIARQ